MKCLALVLFCSLWLASVYAQQPGDLDSTFAVNGKLLLAEHGSVQEILPVEDGILVLARDGATGSVVLKLTYDGDLDTTFAAQGRLFFPHRMKRLIGLSEGRFLTVGNDMGGRLNCFDADGATHDAYGENGEALIEGFITDADKLPDDRIVVSRSGSDSIATATSSARINVIQADGTMDPNVGIYFLSIISWCPNGSFYKGYNCNQVRIMNNEIVFTVISSQYHSCGPNPTYYTTTRYRYTTDGQLITSTVGSLTSTYYSYPLQWKVTSDQRLIESFRVSSSISTGDSFVVGSDNLGYLPYPWFPGIQCSLQRFGKVGEDQQGRFIIPVTHCGYYYFTYRSMPFGLGLDPLWGTNGLLPAEGTSPIPGGAMAAAVQPDNKVLSGGYLTINGEHHFALFRYHNTPSLSNALQAKAILAGPYSEIGGAMKDNLRLEGYLPDTHTPAMGFNAVGNPILQHIPADVLEVTGDSAVVDWVWLELVSAQDLTTVVASKAALVLRNGAITAEDGHSPVDMNCGEGSFHLRVRHRNHLAVMAADAIDLGADTVMADLTSPATAVFGQDARMNINGIMALWPGDVTANGEVKYLGAGNDRDPILISIGGSVPTATITGYHREDVNLDGVVKYVGTGNDRDLILQTIGGAVPTAVRLEQGP